MKVKRGVGFLVVIIILILCLSIVSAGIFSDYWNRVTGKVFENSNVYSCYNYDDGTPRYVGDVDGDKNLTIEDVKLIDKIYHGKINLAGSECCADLNNDGAITPQDWQLIYDSYLQKKGLIFGVCPSVTPGQCVDSDNGKNIYKKGTTNGKNGEYTDYCFIGKGILYYKKNESGRGLKEYFCRKNGKVADFNFICPEGCKNGACIRDVEEVNCENEGILKSCSSDDDCIKIQGSCCPCSSGGYEIAINKQCKEYYRENILPKCSDPIFCPEVYNCLDVEAKCIDNQCQLIPSQEEACVDSDNGKNYYVKGRVNGEEDKCINMGARVPQIVNSCGGKDDEMAEFCRLQEYFCEDNQIESLQYICPNGCKDGACIKEPIEGKPVCGNGICESEKGENEFNCQKDCPVSEKNKKCSEKCLKLGYDYGLCKGGKIVPRQRWCSQNERPLGGGFGLYCKQNLFTDFRYYCCCGPEQEDQIVGECVKKGKVCGGDENLKCCPGLRCVKFGHYANLKKNEGVCIVSIFDRMRRWFGF